MKRIASPKKINRFFELAALACGILILAGLLLALEHDRLPPGGSLLGTSGTSTQQTSAPVVESPQQNYRYGISLGDTLFSMSSDQISAEFDDIASLGFGWVRFDMAWDDIQPSTSTAYRWGQIDTIVAQARTHHLKLLPILAYTPAWARPPTCAWSDKCAPRDPAQFATYAETAAARYRGMGVYAWEIWNEPNITNFWLPQPDAHGYATLLEDSYAAIKSADPTVLVISGGLSPASDYGADIAPVEFLSQLYAQGAGASFDAVGFHPYTYPYLPSAYRQSSAWAQLASTSISIRSVMTANGDAAKQVWLTEFGAPTGGPGSVASADNLAYGSSADHVSEALQSDMIADAIRLTSASAWAGPLFIYSYKDIGTSEISNENFFGLIRNDGTPKPSYSMVKQFLSVLK